MPTSDGRPRGGSRQLREPDAGADPDDEHDGDRGRTGGAVEAEPARRFPRSGPARTRPRSRAGGPPWCPFPPGNQGAELRKLPVCSRTCLTRVVPVAVEVELAVRRVGRPAGVGEEAAQGVVGGDRPEHRARGTGRPAWCRRRPGAAASRGPCPRSRGVDGELHQLGVGDRVAVGVGGGSGDREARRRGCARGRPAPGCGRPRGLVSTARQASAARAGSIAQRLGRQQVGVQLRPGARPAARRSPRRRRPRRSGRRRRRWDLRHGAHPVSADAGVTARRPRCCNL